MNLRAYAEHRERSIIASIREQQEGIGDAVGKGSNIEELIARQLLQPHMPSGFGCNKGTVVMGRGDIAASPAHDRVIWDQDAASPLIFGPEHSVFPIEAVAGAVEITINIDRGKLREDIEKLCKLRAMRTRRYLVPVKGSGNLVAPMSDEKAMSPRAFIIGFPSGGVWKAQTVVKVLTDVQNEFGPTSYIHGVYIIGVGFFANTPATVDGKLQVVCHSDGDRLFRFTSEFRRAFDRWPRRPQNWTADLSVYMPALNAEPDEAPIPSGRSKPQGRTPIARPRRKPAGIS